MNLRFIRALGYIAGFIVKTTPKRAKLRKLSETDPKEADRLSHEAIKGALEKAIKICRIDMDIEGMENIPQEPCLFVANHQSYFDVVVMEAVLPAGAGFVAKDSLGKIPGLKGYMELIHCLLLDRSNIKEGIKVLLKGAEYIKDGYSMFIFPEGTRSKDGNLLEFKGGSLKIAQKAKCPIVPVAISGTRDIYENNAKYTIKPAQVKIVFGEPVEIAKMPRAQQKMLLEELKESIQTLLVNNRN